MAHCIRCPISGIQAGLPRGCSWSTPKSRSQKPLRLTQSMGKQPADLGRGAREAWVPAWWQTASAAPSSWYKQASPEGAHSRLLGQNPLRLTQSMGKPADPGRGAREAWWRYDTGRLSSLLAIYEWNLIIYLWFHWQSTSFSLSNLLLLSMRYMVEIWYQKMLSYDERKSVSHNKFTKEANLKTRIVYLYMNLGFLLW